MIGYFDIRPNAILKFLSEQAFIVHAVQSVDSSMVFSMSYSGIESEQNGDLGGMVLA